VLDASTPWVQRVIDGIKANSTEKWR
jgi:hypothetical protein